MALRRAFTQAILRRSNQTSSSSSSSSTSAGLSALYSSSSSSSHQNRMISTSSRSNYAGGESTQTSVEKFQELFDKYRPSMMDPPGTPSTYMPAEDVAKSGEEEVKNAGPPPETVIFEIPGLLAFTMYLPSLTLLIFNSAEVFTFTCALATPAAEIDSGLSTPM